MKHTLRTRLLRATLLGLVLLGLCLAGRTLYALWELDFPSVWVRAYCTIAASLTLAVGGIAALRNRTWGLLLLVVAAMSFAGAWAFGIAPFGYLTAAAGGLTALALAAKPLWHRDRAAFCAAVGLVVALGVATAALAGPGLDAAQELLLAP